MKLNNHTLEILDLSCKNCITLHKDRAIYYESKYNDIKKDSDFIEEEW